MRQVAEEESSTEQNRIKKGYKWSAFSLCVHRKKKPNKDNIEKERKKKKLYVLERKLGVRNEEETEQILAV